MDQDTRVAMVFAAAVLLFVLIIVGGVSYHRAQKTARCVAAIQSKTDAETIRLVCGER